MKWRDDRAYFKDFANGRKILGDFSFEEYGGCKRERMAV